MSVRRSKVKAMSVFADRPWLRHYDYWVPERASFPRQSVFEVLNLAATQFSDRPATAFVSVETTFGELRRQAERLAAALCELGIRKGDRVGIMLPNCPQYLVSFFAIARLGAIATNVNPLYTPREVALVIADSGMRAIIALDLLAATIQAVSGGSPIETIITTSMASDSSIRSQVPATPEGTLALSDLIADADVAALPKVDCDAENDVAALVYTGGTTGLPKGAMLTHCNLFAAVVQCSLWGGPFIRRGEDRFLVVIPYFHVYGLVVGMLFGVWQAALQVIIPKYDPKQLLEAVRLYQPTYFPAVPTLFISLLNHPEARNSGLDRVQRFNSGSAPLPVEVLEQFERLSGATLLEGYGMTETAALATTTAALAKRKPGSIGLPVTGTDLKIVDLENGEREVGVGEEGELCIRGPQVMKGYWNKPEETARTIRGGWLYTGDVARMDEDGYFYIVQRKKDLIIVSGFKVYPTEVENVLYLHPAVREAAVIGLSDSYRGELVKAFVVLRPGAAASTEELIEHCRTRLVHYKVPSVIEITDTLPKSAIGKTLRRELREAEEAKRE